MSQVMIASALQSGVPQAATEMPLSDVCPVPIATVFVAEDELGQLFRIIPQAGSNQLALVASEPNLKPFL